MLTTQKYIFSFTGASALIPETIAIAQEYKRLADWDEVKKTVSDQNLLNKVKQATFTREFREIKKRIVLLTDEQLDLLIHGSPDDIKAMVFVSLLKTYSFLFDFVVEVIRSKYLLFDNGMMDSDFTRFINAKSLTHIELEELSVLTAKKVKQVLFTLLLQVGLISERNDGLIIKPYISDESINVILKDQPALLACFLFSDADIRSVIKMISNE
jgi:hypothetical protein